MDLNFHIHLTLVIVFGVLGNAVSFMVSLAPLPTFYLIYKKKTSEGFQSIPYVISLFSAMLWIYYALLIAKGAMFLITINTFCVLIETFYIVTYFYYGPKKEKIVTVKLMLLFNVFGFGVIFLSTFFLNPKIRLKVLGYICMAFSLAVFAAPLAIVRKVIKTKSVEFMPFTLSAFLTLGAVMWFFYGFLLKDRNIAAPNILGFIFGVLQMILYAVYKKQPKKKMVKDRKLQFSEQIAKLSSMVYAVPPEPIDTNNNELSKHSTVVDVAKLGSMVSSEVNAVAPQPIDTNNNELSEHSTVVDVAKLGSMVSSEVNAVAPHPIDTNNNNNNGGTVDAQNIEGNTGDASNKV